MVIKRAKETSKDLLTVYTKASRNSRSISEYHGKPVGQKKGPEMATSQPMKTMLDVLQVTRPNLSKEQELHRVNSEKDILKNTLRKIKGAGKPYYFVYFDMGVDGFPVMLMQKKKIPSDAIKALRGKATKKKMVIGRVSYDASKGRLVFSPYTPPAKLARSLKVYFGGLVPMFKKALISEGDSVPPEELTLYSWGSSMEVMVMTMPSNQRCNHLSTLPMFSLYRRVVKSKHHQKSHRKWSVNSQVLSN